MFAELGTTIRKRTRRGLALTLGTANLAGDAVAHPSSWMRDVERRGERMLRRLGSTPRSIGARVDASATVSTRATAARRRKTAEHRRRSLAAQKAARTRRANEAKGTLEKAVERTGDRIQGAVKELTG